VIFVVTWELLAVANFLEHPTGEVRGIHLLRTSLDILKLPITPIRTQRTPINRINKPKEPTGTPPVTH
jgi:hypothetical protein